MPSTNAEQVCCDKKQTSHGELNYVDEATKPTIPNQLAQAYSQELAQNSEV